ncbi:MAG: hypothetical protein M1368_05240, partial [Thaumarchaeota archaeon]|nr:hypothetical protein [Nitrososphaerota archaeon]
ITNPGSYQVYSGPSVTTNSSGEAEFTIEVPVSNISEVNENYTVPIMAHPLLYDIRKVFFSKTVLISMILLIGVSFFLVSSFSVSSTGTSQFPNVQVMSWYDNSGTYHFLVFETNQFGQPVSGPTLQANLTVDPFPIGGKGPITNPGSYQVYSGPSVTTNSSGEAEFTI